MAQTERTVLRLAIEKGYFGVVQALLEAGADKEAKTTVGRMVKQGHGEKGAIVGIIILLLSSR